MVTDVKTVPCVRNPQRARIIVIVPETLSVFPVNFQQIITVKLRERQSRRGFVPIKELVSGPRPFGSATVLRSTTGR